MLLFTHKRVEMEFFLVFDFNTSNVTIYLKIKDCNNNIIINFNTSNVTIYRFGLNKKRFLL